MIDAKTPATESMEIRCPQCNKTVKVPLEQATRHMTVRCPNGHEIPLMKVL